MSTTYIFLGVYWCQYALLESYKYIWQVQACGVESAAEDRGYNKDDVTAAFNAVRVSCSRCSG